MKKTFKALAGGLSGVGVSALPILALAQTAPPPPFTTLDAFKTFICTVVVGWLFTFLIILAVVFVLVAAFKYLTAAGDPEKVKSASHQLVYAAVAVVVALFARGVPLIVGSLFSGGTGGIVC